MGALDKFVQQTIPGLHSLSGAERIPGRTGMWYVQPSKLSELGWLEQARKELQAEGNLARKLSGLKSEPPRYADMTQGAIEDMLYAAKLKDIGGGESSRGVVYVSPSGHVRGAAALDIEKAAEYLGDPMDLDMTRTFPAYLEYVGATSPEVRGRDMLRAAQERLGNQMVFQVAKPKVNVPKYQAMGAQRMPLNEYGIDPLGGTESLPAFQISERIPESVVRRPSKEQMSFEGFRHGGLATYHRCNCGR